MTIWADGDSLQAELRRLLCRRANLEAAAAAAEGRPARFRAVFVAARMPPLDAGPGVEAIVVPNADDRIAADSIEGDLAVTRDLPLAERLADKGLRVLNDRGEVFSAETPGSGGPSAIGRSSFAPSASPPSRPADRAGASAS